MALIGTAAEAGLVAEVAGQSLPEVLDDARPAVRLGLLVAPLEPNGAYQFPHALVREFLLSELPADVRLRGHATVATCLADRRAAGASIAAGEIAAQMSAAGSCAPPAEALLAFLAAADDADASLAHEQAAAFVALALAALPEDTPSDERLALLLRLGEARRRAGNVGGARDALKHAEEVAHHAGDPQRRADAVLALQRIGLPTGFADADRASLFTSALNALRPDDRLRRARLLAAAAQDRYHSHVAASAQGARELAEEGVGIAEAAGDASTLARCLLALHDVLWGPGTAVERAGIAKRLQDVAAAAGDDEARLLAMLNWATALLELGDPRALTYIERFVELAEASRLPILGYYALSRRALLAMVSGDLATAEALARAAERRAEELGEADGPQVAIGQLSEIGALGGRRGELQPRRLPPGHTLAEIQRAHVALAAMQSGRLDEAAVLAKSLLSDPASIPRDYAWLQHLSMLAELARGIGDRAAATLLYDLLEPFAGTCVVVAGSVSFRGAVDRYLALLAFALDRNADAERHRVDACRIHARLGATAWDLPAWPPAPPRPCFSVVGRKRRVEYAGLLVEVSDGKGMGDIAGLLARPGAEVHVAELANVVSGQRIETLDERARHEYGARLRQLEQALDDADARNDVSASSELAAERQAILAALSSASGLGGRPRFLPDEVERARKAVSARIHYALDRLEKVHPSMASHLRENLTVGTWCSYRPPDPPHWVL